MAKTPAIQPAVPTGPQFDNRRIAAGLIDLLIPLVAFIAAKAAGLSLTRGLVLVGVGWTLYYFFALESGNGQTLGKRAMKLRVLSADGTAASMEQIAKRTIVRILDGHIIGLIVMLATGDRRLRLGDIVAGTVVTEAASTTAAPAAGDAAAPAPPVAKRSFLKRPIGKPSLPKPSLAKPSLRRPSASGRLAFLKAPIGTPSLRKRSQPARLDEPAGERPIAARPEQEYPTERLPEAPPRAPAPPEAEPFELFAQPASEPAPYADHEPQVEFDRPAPQVEFDAPEPRVEEDEPDPLADLGDREPVVEFDEPMVEIREPVVEFDEPVVEFDEPVVDPGEPEPGRAPGPEPSAQDTAEAPTRPLVPAKTDEDRAAGGHEDPAPAPEQAEDPEPEMTIKPIQTVSAIDLVMQDAEDQRPPGR